MGIYYVYIILDPRKQGKFEYDIDSFEYEPFYVGKGKGHRWKQHLQPSKQKENTPKNNKIKVIKKLNLEPILLKYKEHLEEKEAYLLETKLIQQIGRHDTKQGPLTNLNDGGKGGFTPSIEVKSRISASMKGRPKPQEWKDMMKIKMKGKNNSPSTQFQKGYSPWNKGSSLSQEDQSISSIRVEQH